METRGGHLPRAACAHAPSFRPEALDASADERVCQADCEVH